LFHLSGKEGATSEVNHLKVMPSMLSGGNPSLK
jgi:hypothetical protein